MSLYAHWLHANRASAELSATLRRIAHANPRMTGKSAAELAAAARAELATPHRYHLARTVVGATKPWWAVLLSWLGNLIDALVRALAAHIKVGPSLRPVLGDTLIVAILLTVAFFAARLLRALQVARGGTHATVRPLSALPSAHALVVDANAFAAAGDYRRAIRALFIAALTLLDLRGVVHAQSSSTVNELRCALKNANERVEPTFVALAGHFTQAIYAEKRPGPEDWLEARDAYVGIAESLSIA